jgi:hypothetical protein
MPNIGIDPSRVDLPGGVVAVSVRWVQRGINAWRVARASTIGAVAEDGAWGPNTSSALVALTTEIDPGFVRAITPTEDRRAVVISRKIEGYISSLNRVSAASTTTTPVVDFTPSGPPPTSLAVAQPDTLVVSGSGVEPWVYVLGAATFLVTAGVTYVALDTK